MPGILGFPGVAALHTVLDLSNGCVVEQPGLIESSHFVQYMSANPSPSSFQ